MILIPLMKIIAMINLNNKIHLRNISSLLVELENLAEYLPFDEFKKDDVTKMNCYRLLTLIGLEAFNIRGKFEKNKLINTLKSFRKADYLSRFGREEYAVWNFLRNDLEYIRKELVGLILLQKKTLGLDKHSSCTVLLSA